MRNLRRVLSMAAAALALLGISGAQNYSHASSGAVNPFSISDASVAAGLVPGCYECQDGVFGDPEHGYYGMVGLACDILNPVGCADCNFGKCEGWGWYTEPCSVGCTLAEDLQADLRNAVESEDATTITKLLDAYPSRLAIDNETLQGFNCNGTVDLELRLSTKLNRAIQLQIAETIAGTAQKTH
jgi:hypothetical protein